MSLEQRDFYDAVEWWAGRWKYGDAISFAGLTACIESMDDGQREMLALYLRQLPYDVYLDTRHWYVVRRRKLAESNNRCATCGRASMEVHHADYRIRGREHENLDRLSALCGPCHSIIHETAKFVEGRR